MNVIKESFFPQTTREKNKFTKQGSIAIEGKIKNKEDFIK